MPYKNEYVPPEVFLEHNGVKVYHTYYGGQWGRRARDTFTLHADDTNPSAARAFYALDLKVPAMKDYLAKRPLEVGDAAVRMGMDMATFMATIEYHQLIQAWRRWSDDLRPAAVRQAVIEALDAGILK